MTTKSEDVLLQMGGVRFKKGDGTLYVMNERLAWMAENRDKVAVSHSFQDIKMQKISPDGKPKIQLQVVLHDGNSSTFHFVNRNGLDAQKDDRDKVKELLQHLLPNFKRKVDKELEEKNRILSENPRLLQLYKDLVITQVLSSEEFWLTHAKDYTRQKNSQKQDIGVSGAFLADIKPQTDGCNGLKYNLTADIIECIFKTYPAVKRKHVENVPSKLSESEFWTKFFQSHYFHRDRLNAGTKDLFTECGKIDDQTFKLAVAKVSGDVLYDLRTFEDNTLQDGFGGSTTSEKSGVNSGNIVHQNLIKRFNQHSIMVLNASSSNLPNGLIVDKNSIINNNINNDMQSSETTAGPSSSGTTAATNGLKEKLKRNSNSLIASEIFSNNMLSEPKTKQARILEKIQFDDLEEDKNSKDREPSQLNLLKLERYLHGPVPISSSLSSTSSPSLMSDINDDVQLPNMETVQAMLIESTHNWDSRTPHNLLINSTAAVNALGELSPGGALMRGFQEQTLAQLVPRDIEKEIKNLYLSLSELLKHFWHSFPPNTPELEDKFIRMHESLKRFEATKLTPFEERLMRELSPLGTTLTQHFNQLLHLADRKFITWQDRRMRQHR